MHINLPGYTQEASSDLNPNSLSQVINLYEQGEFYIASQELLLSEVQQTQGWKKDVKVSDINQDSALWVRIELNNTYSETINLSLVIGSVFVDEVDAFLLDEYGRIIQSERNSATRVIPSDSLQGLGFSMQILARPNSRYSLYVRIKDDAYQLIPIDVWHSEAFDTESKYKMLLLSAMSGALSLLACYFLFTYILKNAPERFWFCVFTSAVMSTILCAEGVISSMFMMPAYTAELTSLGLVVTFFASIKITRIIFSPMSSKWIYAHYVSLSVPLLGVLFLNDYQQFIVLVGYASAFFVSKLIASIVYRKSLDIKSATIYLIAWLMLGISGLYQFILFFSTGFNIDSSSPFPFVFVSLSVALIGVAIISREQSLTKHQLDQGKASLNYFKHYSDLFNFSAEGLFSATASGELLHVNPAMCALFGYVDQSSLLRDRPKLSNLFAHKQEIELLFGELSIQKTVLGKEVKGIRKDGTEFWLSISCQLHSDAKERVQFGSMFDVTERRLHQINLQYQNTHDQLTGLFNRRYFLHKTTLHLKQAHDSNVTHALIYLDIDQFKVINDTCGYIAGDIYIKELSHELFDIVSDTYPFARLSADQFALLVHYSNVEELHNLASKLLAKVKNYEFKWERHSFCQSMSIGVVAIDNDFTSSEELLSLASSACQIAKEYQLEKIHYYTSNQDENKNYNRDVHWVNEVLAGLENNNFEIFYQHYRPLNQVTNLDYFEVLLRLRTQNNDLIAPEIFMPAAEKMSVSTKLDKFVIEHSFKWMANQPNMVENLGMININLSSMSLIDEEFRYFLMHAFEKYDIQHTKVCFELNESIAIIHMRNAIDFMRDFRQLGCKFALDDFGSGFSSYNYLKQLPIDMIKIDGQYIRDILHDPIDLAMVTAIRDVASAMGILTSAELVETQEILVELGKLGVDYAQGFTISQPQPLSSYSSFVDS